MLILLGQKLEQGVRRVLPLATTLALVLLSVMAWPLPHIGVIKPSLGMIAVYYWSIHRPDLFRPQTAFFLGLLQDIVHYLPIGLSALFFVGIHQLVLSQRRLFIGQTFFVFWTGFALVMALVACGHILVVSAYNGQWLTMGPVFLQNAMTVAIFPLVAWALILLQRHVLSQS